jgi:uncharacterized membrane protein YcaP (DUF421 family)
VTAILDTAFGTDSHLVWWQECNRAFVVFVYGLLMVRLAGRRVFGKWSALDIVVSIIVGSILGRALTGGAPLFGTLAAATLLIALHWVLAKLTAHSSRFADWIEGTPVRLVPNGAVLSDNLRREAISERDLHEALRENGLEDPAQAREARLEPSGKITVLKE